MTTKSINAGNEGMNYSNQEKEFIKTIIKCQGNITTLANKIGECCDKLIKLNNGIQYGDKTLKRIANYPGINCSEFHLRRCWNFFRLMTNKDYINADLKTLSKTPSAVYHLARIMNSPLLPKEKKICLVKEIAKRAVAENMLVDHIAIEVSMKLHAEENKDKKQEKPEKPQKKPDIINEKNLEQVTKSIQTAVKSPLLLKEIMGNKVVCKRIFNLMNESMNFIEKMPDYCHDNEITQAITDLVRRLSPIAARMKIVQK